MSEHEPDTEPDTTSDAGSDELGPMPTPQIEPGEPNPGGVDAVPEDEDDEDPLTADLAIENNPAIDDAATPALSGGEDTSTEATKGDGADQAPEDPA